MVRSKVGEGLDGKKIELREEKRGMTEKGVATWERRGEAEKVV